MNTIFEKWFMGKCFSVRNYEKSWKEVGNEPRIYFHHNNAKFWNAEDSCLDVSLIIGYTIFNYTDFEFNKLLRKIKRR